MSHLCMWRRPCHHCDVNLHVEDADSTQSSACPLFLVIVQSRVHRVGKFANDRNRPSRSGQMCLFVSVNNLWSRRRISQHIEAMQFAADLPAR